MTVKVNEIFYSIQGETTTAGYPSLFIRLTGCNLHCSYCDTEYARHEGRDMDIADIVDIVESAQGAHHITITGGEPLCQDETIKLMEQLRQKGYMVQLETNGSVSLKDVPFGVRKIVDIKTPSSGEEASFFMQNLDHITEGDEIKFVVSDSEDFNFAARFIREHLQKTRCVINISPVHGRMKYDDLAGLILREKLPVRLNIQLHRVIWNSDKEDKTSLLE